MPLENRGIWRGVRAGSFVLFCFETNLVELFDSELYVDIKLFRKKEKSSKISYEKCQHACFSKEMTYKFVFKDLIPSIGKETDSPTPLGMSTVKASHTFWQFLSKLKVCTLWTSSFSFKSLSSNSHMLAKIYVYVYRCV